MMVSPQGFLEYHSDESYKELLPVRDELLAAILSFEEHKDDPAEDMMVCPSPEVVYQCNLEYLAKLCELIAEKYNREYVWDDQEKEDVHYLFKIRDFLERKCPQYNSFVLSSIEERNAGRAFSTSDHIKGLVHSLLTAQTKWHRIEPHLPEIDKLFFNYDVEKIKRASAEHFYNGLFALKCGNRSTKAQMEALHYNITVFEKIAAEYGSVDAFVTSAPAHEIVRRFSKAGSPYKLRMLGDALVWEYLRNLGIDGAKPDTHLRRFLSKDRMGTGNSGFASADEVAKQVDDLSEETGLTKREIDNLIWSFCADGFGEVCTASPHCDICVIRENCRRGTYLD